MKKFFLVLTFLPLLSLGQTNPDYPLLIPASLKLKPILDSTNYIETEPRLAILKYLGANKLNPKNYFIDSALHKTGDTLYIQVWDVVGIKTINSYERKRDSLDKANKISGKKLKWPHPVGNPGYCFTVYFDLKNNILIAAEYWQ